MLSREISGATAAATLNQGALITDGEAPDVDHTSPVEGAIRRAIEALDMDAIQRVYWEQEEFVFVERFLPGDLAEQAGQEARRLIPRAHRAYVPFIRKAGTVGQSLIREEAPTLYALYSSPSFLAFAAALSKAPLALKSEGDAHAAALYIYNRPADHVGFHYDSCGCDDEASYTATFGILNETKQSRFQARLFHGDKSRPPKDLLLSTEPGSMILLCGSKAYHRVTPIAAGDLRVTYSFAYVREGKRIQGTRRFTENIKDAILYFGPKALFQKNYR